MARALLLSVVAGLLLALPSGAAPVGSGRIGFAIEGGSLYTVISDGRGLQSLRIGGGNNRLSSPRWSPDGSQVAFTENRTDPNQTLLWVMNSNETGAHVVATGSILLSTQPWSPDGSRIAWGSALVPGDLFTASAAGGDVRRLTTDGLRKEPPVWSPTGSNLVYAAAFGDPQRWELFTVGADGIGRAQITSGGQGMVRNIQPSWSPDGSTIAFLREINSDGAIYVVQSDGTELHRVAATRPTFYTGAEPAWSPDGSKIAYTNGVNSGISRYGPPPGQEIFVVDADGSGERRLTELAPKLVADGSPTWSPDGDQIVFRRGATGSLVTMNPDGTCEEAITDRYVVGAPSWQKLPGAPPAGPKTCRAVSVDASATALGDVSSFFIAGTVRNEGTETLTNLFITFKAPRHDLGITDYGSGCSSIPSGILCRIDRLERGQARAVAALGTARRVGRDQRSHDVALRADVKVTADGPLVTTERETDEVRFTPGRCTPTDRGRGRIDGTRFPDRICGRRGADDIHPWAGKDLVNAGAGSDKIFSKDENSDVIRCGPGRDLVIADQKDKVARNCERVRRG
jgi:Tol biopolymer transport system component